MTRWCYGGRGGVDGGGGGGGRVTAGSRSPPRGHQLGISIGVNVATT